MGFIFFKCFCSQKSGLLGTHVGPKDNKGEWKSFIRFAQPAVEIQSGASLYNLSSEMMIISSSSC